MYNLYAEALRLNCYVEALRRAASIFCASSIISGLENISSRLCDNLRFQLGYSLNVPGIFTGLSICNQSSSCSDNNALEPCGFACRNLTLESYQHAPLDVKHYAI